MVQRRQFFSHAAALAASVLPIAAPVPAHAHSKTLRIVVGYTPGGGSDSVARIVAEKLGLQLGRSVVVENRVGAGGRVAAQYVKNAPANQPMLLLANSDVMVVAPLVVNEPGYDVDKDFVPVSQVNRFMFGVAVSNAVPVRDMGQLLDWIKANPAQSSIGVPAIGSLPHFFALRLGKQAGVLVEGVGYRGAVPLVTDLISGQIPLAVGTLDTLVQPHDAGELRILAVSGDTRTPIVPQVPTLQESGVDLAATGWTAFFASQRMPAAQVQRYSDAIQKVMQDPEVQQDFKIHYLDAVVASAAQTRANLEAYRKQWEPVIRESGYRSKG